METEPQDLGIKIAVSKAEANWTSILEQSEKLILEGEANLEINKGIAELATKRISEEQNL